MNVRLAPAPEGVEAPLCRGCSSQLLGIIPPWRAAMFSAKVAEDAARSMDYELPRSIFCRTFGDEMNLKFQAAYPKLGARVTQP